MHKLFFTIVFICYCMPRICAQDPRFEYKDTSLLNEGKLPEVTENSTYQEPIDEGKDIFSDTTLYITDIEIPPDTLVAWKKDRRFAYVKNLDSLLKIKQQQDLAHLNDRKDSGSFFQRLLSSAIMEILFWAIAIGFVFFILYRLFLSEGIFRRNTASSAVTTITEAEEIVTVSDYDKLLHQSVKLGDYRMAVRYLFLKTLAQLAGKEYVQLSVDKTNYQYLQEIGADKKDEFASLVRTYEYTWYGNFPLNGEAYTSIERKFNLFYNKI